MLAKVLHTHLDKLEELEKQVQEDIDDVLSHIDRKALMKDPRETLIDVVEAIRELMIEKYMPLSSKEGFHLASIVKQKDLIVDPSKNPTVNS